jgi:hypothetical protein
MLDESGRGCEVGMCPYKKPKQIAKELAGRSLKDVRGSWVLTSRGDVYCSGEKVRRAQTDDGGAHTRTDRR